MFKLFVFLACAYACMAAAVDNQVVPILSEEIVVEHDGKFHYNYESGDGTKVQEVGEVKVVDKDTSVESVRGSYEYSSPDGQKVHVEYTADENGYQPHGDVLPVAPAIPEVIQRAIKYNEEHPQPQEKVVARVV